MVETLCFLENVPKHCLKPIGRNRLRPQELKQASLLDLSFRIAGCYIQILSN